MEKCFVCDKNILTTEANRVLKSQSIATVTAASVKRNDDKHAELTDVESIKVHTSCYKSYVSESNIAAAKKRKLSSGDSIVTPSRTNKAKVDFNFSELCVICGTNAGSAYYAKNQRKSRRLSHGSIYT